MRHSREGEIKLIFAFTISLVVFISLLTFDPNDIKFFTSSPNASMANVVGFVGAYLAWVLFFIWGFGAYVIPILIVLWSMISLAEEKPRSLYLRIFGGFFLILAISSIFSILGPEENFLRFNRGGMLGLVFSDFLLRSVGPVGTFTAIVLLFLLSFLIATDLLIFPFVIWLFKISRSLVSRLKPPGGPRTVKIKEKPLITPQTKKEAPPSVKLIKPKETKKEQPKVEEEKKLEAKAKVALEHKEPYKFPSIELLKSPPPIEERAIKEDLDESSKILEETLEDFGIEAKVVNVSKGPVITRYELEPASGVKVHKITSLSDNIALAMKAVSIRIVAPVPGKGTIGVEVPNPKGTLVYIREILQSKEYKESTSKLKLILGKDISGASVVTDLGDMPHLLIAGATGSGKTVCVNSIIMTLLYNASPDELKLLMVDPKRVELAPFNELPHLLAPVVTDSKKVSHALGWVVEEMDRRYELFAELGVRNIDAYNKRSETESLTALPYIVIVIDELADLMLVAQQEIENTITRLAQLSRAVGIHMIIATQRPSVDVITGVIKANFPSRVSFKVASKVDSRTVLDMNGAEKLLGRGDMLFVESKNPKPVRAQGCLVSDEEISKVTAFIRAQRKPSYEEAILKTESKQMATKFEKDEVYEEALKLVLQTRQASVSMLQRRLGVGYTRAARLIDMMEDEGIVGPYQGSKPREILLDNVDTLQTEDEES